MLKLRELPAARFTTSSVARVGPVLSGAPEAGQMTVVCGLALAAAPIGPKQNVVTEARRPSQDAGPVTYTASAMWL